MLYKMNLYNIELTEKLKTKFLYTFDNPAVWLMRNRYVEGVVRLAGWSEAEFMHRLSSRSTRFALNGKCILSFLSLRTFRHVCGKISKMVYKKAIWFHRTSLINRSLIFSFFAR